MKLQLILIGLDKNIKKGSEISPPFFVFGFVL
jgi:hypothetical protein